MAISPEEFKEQLEQLHEFPSVYMFKFIVPKDREGEVMKLFPDTAKVSTKDSKNSNYVSVTAEMLMNTSDEVIEIYNQAYLIDGIISL